MKDKDLVLLGLFLVVLMLFLARRKRPVTSVKIGSPTEYGDIGVPLGPREAMDTALVRICTYETRALEWRLGDACPPNYNNENLLSDSLTTKLPYDASGGQGTCVCIQAPCNC